MRKIAEKRRGNRMDLRYDSSMIFKKMEKERFQAVNKASLMGLLVNGFLAVVKLIIGLYSNSLTIISDSVNQFMDSLSSAVAMIFAHISRRNPDPDHPRGYGRMEYFASFAISLLIMLAGWELLQESVTRIFHPEEMKLDTFGMVFLLISVVVKYLLSSYQIKVGEKWDFDPLSAAGRESRIDVLQSSAAFVSALLTKYQNLNFDAWCAAVISLLLLRTAAGIMKDAVEDLIGRSDDSEASQMIYDLIENEKEFTDAYDLVLHSYGPMNQFGSIKVQLRSNPELSTAMKRVAALKKKIMQETGIRLTFELRPCPEDCREIEVIRADVINAAMRVEGTREIRGFYSDKEGKDISFDATLDYALRDLRQYRKAVTDEIRKSYPDARVVMEVNMVKRK